MRMLKTSVKITHGGGITDSTLTKLVHALPRCIPICDSLEQFTAVHNGTSEQHRDLRQNIQARNARDRCVFLERLQAEPPLAGYETDRLVSLSTSLVADIQFVNCDNAIEILSKGDLRNAWEEVLRNQTTS